MPKHLSSKSPWAIVFEPFWTSFSVSEEQVKRDSCLSVWLFLWGWKEGQHRCPWCAGPCQGLMSPPAWLCLPRAAPAFPTSRVSWLLSGCSQSEVLMGGYKVGKGDEGVLLLAPAVGETSGAAAASWHQFPAGTPSVVGVGRGAQHLGSGTRLPPSSFSSEAPQASPAVVFILLHSHFLVLDSLFPCLMF